MKCSLCFYDTTHVKLGKILKFFGVSPVQHCAIMFYVGGRHLVLAADKTHKAKIVDADVVHTRFKHPSYIFELGESKASIKSLMSFISVPYKGSTWAMAWWKFFTNIIVKELQPRSCTVLSAQMARFCGFKIKDYVDPSVLFKELLNASDFNCWKGESWEDYLSENHR